MYGSTHTHPRHYESFGGQRHHLGVLPQERDPVAFRMPRQVIKFNCDRFLPQLLHFFIDCSPVVRRCMVWVTDNAVQSVTGASYDADKCELLLYVLLLNVESNDSEEWRKGFHCLLSYSTQTIETDGKIKTTSFVQTVGRQTCCHYQQVTLIPNVPRTPYLASCVWAYWVTRKPCHVWNKILSLLCHKFANFWCLNAACHEERILSHLSSRSAFIIQENKMKRQITFIAVLTVVAYFSSSAHLIIFSPLHLF
jgi:hypothetical protein